MITHLRGRRRTPRSGFTLIELMIVVVVMGILAAIAVPLFLDYTRSAKEAESRPLMRQIYTLQYRYQAKHGVFAEDLGELEGGEGLALSGEYFTYSMIPHETGFCVVATPNDAGTVQALDAQSLDADGEYHESGDCS